MEMMASRMPAAPSTIPTTPNILFAKAIFPPYSLISGFIQERNTNSLQL
jgi:hypothetical protein